jgi:glycosyltransferase involved in cell wall biosynthesis
MKLVIDWICQLPMPYNEQIFNELGKDEDIDLTVHYIDESSASYPWKASVAREYKARFYERVLGFDFHVLGKSLARRSRVFVIGGWHEPTVIALLVLVVLLGRRFVIWTDAPDLMKKRIWWKRLLRSLFLRWLFRRVPAVMGTGKLALDNLAAMGCPGTKLVNYPYVANLQLFYGVTKPKPRGDLVSFISCGRLVNEHKGYDLALRALAALKSNGVLRDFRYRIAGAGPDLDALKELSQALDVERNVEFTGWIEEVGLREFYQSGNIFLHPALFEPYGVVVIEAMAAGLVVVGSDQTGAAVDRIANRENGFLFRSGDVESLVSAIQCALGMRNVWEEMGSRAREAVIGWNGRRAANVVKNLLRAISENQKAQALG